MCLTVHVCADDVSHDRESIGRATALTLEQSVALTSIEQTYLDEEDCVFDSRLLLKRTRRVPLTADNLLAASELSRKQSKLLVEVLQHPDNTHMALMLMTGDVDQVPDEYFELKHLLCWALGVRMVVEDHEPSRPGQPRRQLPRLAQTGYVTMKRLEVGTLCEGVNVYAHEQMPYNAFVSLPIETRPLQCHKERAHEHARMNASPMIGGLEYSDDFPQMGSGQNDNETMHDRCMNLKCVIPSCVKFVVNTEALAPETQLADRQLGINEHDRPAAVLAMVQCVVEGLNNRRQNNIAAVTKKCLVPQRHIHTYIYRYIYIDTYIHRELLDLGGLQTLVGILGQPDAPVTVNILG